MNCKDLALRGITGTMLVGLGTAANAAQPGSEEAKALIATLVFGAALYVAPSWIAFSRKHNNKWAIFATNVLVGWTIVGWIVSLVWALTSPQRVEVISVNAPAQNSTPNSDIGIKPIPTSWGNNKADELSKLKQLLDSGHLTTEEFNRFKLDLLKT